MIFWHLFHVFFKIGLFGFGGGYAMLSLIEHEVVERYGWIDSSKFADMIAISQMTPGPISINCATYVGYQAVIQAGYPAYVAVIGSILASLALCLPSLVLMWLVLKYLLNAKNKEKIPWIDGTLNSLKPAVVGLIFASAIMLMTPANFTDYKSIIICAISFILVLSKKVNPIFLIILSGFAGYILYN